MRRPALVWVVVSIAATAAIAATGSCSRSDAAAAGSAAGASTKAAAATTQASGAPAARAPDSVNAAADRGRILGDSNAKVWLVMASDFQCPFCKQWHDASFPGIVKKYVATGRVRLAYLNMPLSIHEHAVQAAEAAMCASAQNKFWTMHDSLFATQKIWETLADPGTFFDTLANHDHADMARWRDCVARHLTRPLIEADYDRARRSGANSTPTFFAGSTMLSSADADVAGALDAALAAKNKP